MFPGHDPLHVAVQAHGQAVGVAGRDQPQVGIEAEHEGGEAAGDELALAVLGRHEDHQTAGHPAGTHLWVRGAAGGHVVEPLGQFRVVPVRGVVRLGVGREGQQVLSCVRSEHAFPYGIRVNAGHGSVKKGVGGWVMTH